MYKEGIGVPPRISEIFETSLEIEDRPSEACPPTLKPWKAGRGSELIIERDMVLKAFSVAAAWSLLIFVESSLLDICS